MEENVPGRSGASLERDLDLEIISYNPNMFKGNTRWCLSVYLKWDLDPNCNPDMFKGDTFREVSYNIGKTG